MTLATFAETTFRRDLADASRRFLEDRELPDTARPERGSDPALWDRVAREMGWVGLAVSEERGGLGAALDDLGAVAEEAGRVLLGIPVTDSATVAYVLDRFVGGEVADRLVPGLASGELVATAAFDTALTLRGGGRSGPGVLGGRARWVVAGGRSDVLLAPAEDERGPVLLLLERGVLDHSTDREIELTDHTRPVHHLSFDGAEVPEGAVVARGDEALAVGAAARAVRSVVLACEDVGGAERALEISVDYAKARRQFGVPIGSFQAIKHKLADVLLRVEHSRTATRVAAQAGDGNLVERAVVAKAHADETFTRAGAEMIQVHGGIGFTTEHPAHLFYKRASVNAQLVWSAAACREHLRRALFGSAEAPRR